MENYSVRKIILLILVFVVSIIVGYIITRSIKSMETSTTLVDTPSVSVHNPDTLAVDTPIVSVNNPDTLPVDTPSVSVTKPDTPVIKKKPSEKELTRIINNLNNKNYPRNVKIIYENLKTEEGEQSQQSISNIRNYIRIGVWKSVTVTSFEYDEERGKITSITLRINRNTEE